MYVMVILNTDKKKVLYQKIYLTELAAKNAVEAARGVGIFVALYKLQLVEGQVI